MKKHITAIECESSNGIMSTIDKTDLLLDIKYLINEFYFATFSDADDALNMTFNNGQKFRLTINEIK